MVSDRAWLLAYLELSDSAPMSGGLQQIHSLVASRPIAAGAILQEEDLTAKPPLQGLTPPLKSWVVGRKALYDLKPGDPITFGVIE